MTALNDLLHWVEEREAIRVRKERGDPFPWTDDPILREWRFCCVRREDDRVTRWIRAEIREPFAEHDHLWFMLCAARAINWPDTLDELIRRDAWPTNPFFNEQMLAGVLAQRAERGDKVFTGAYLITAPPTKGASKAIFVGESTLGNLWRDRRRIQPAFEPTSTLAYAHQVLTRYKGWGPFMAYQAIVDARFCDTLLAAAPDVGTWAAAGPGTIRGLNRLAGRPIDAPLTQERALDEMLPLRATIEGNTKIGIDLSDVPNILCETDKYLRVKNGEGTPRVRYVPGRGA